MKIRILDYYRDTKEIKKIKNRTKKEQSDVEKDVRAIIENVKSNKDKALIEFTEKFDKVELKKLVVSKEEIKEAYSSLNLKKAGIVQPDN